MINYQYTGLEKPLGVFDLPIGTALQKRRFSAAGEEGQPISFVAYARDLLVWVTNILEIQIPVGMRLICKMLRLAGYGIDLTADRANLVDNAVVDIAP